MSLIHNNPWLIEKLLKSALEEEKKLYKKGQADPEELTKQNVVALQQQVKALQNQINPPATALTQNNQVSTDSENGAQLKMPDLQNIGSLVMFVARNKITIGGKRIAYGSDEQAPQDDSYRLYKLEGNVSLIPVRSQDLNNAKLTFRINHDLLIKYIQSLQGLNAQTPNPVMGLLLKSVIQEANEQMQTGISEEYKAPEQTLPDTTEVDKSVPQLLDPKKWGATGVLILTAKDIKSIRTLNDWMRQSQVTTTGSDGQPATINDQDFNQCGAIQTLFLRAQSFAQRAGEQNEAQANIYLRQMEAIAGQARCDLSQIASNTSGPRAGELTPETLQELVSLQPFNSQYINTRDIKLFVDKFAALANDPQVTALKQQVDVAVERANSLMQSPGAPIQMSNLTTAAFKLGTTQPAQLASILHTIVSVAGRVYQLFVTEYKDKLGPTARVAEQQIASGGPQSTNLSDLVGLIQNLGREAQRGNRR